MLQQPPDSRGSGQYLNPSTLAIGTNWSEWVILRVRRKMGSAQLEKSLKHAVSKLLLASTMLFHPYEY